MSTEKFLPGTILASSSNLYPFSFKNSFKSSQGFDLNLEFFFHGCLSGCSAKYFFRNSEIFFFSSSDQMCG